MIIDANAQKISKRKIKKLIEKSEINKGHHIGFALYDQEKEKMIYAFNGDKYFIPASNTKLYTFYASLNMLGDSIPGLKYVTKGDSLIFWGTGDPSFLHSTLKSTKAYDFLKNSNKKLFYAAGNYTGNFYGLGWPYGNYDAYYQAEINALPLMDNVAVLSAASNGTLNITPSYFKSYLKRDSSLNAEKFRVERQLFSNLFRYSIKNIPSDFKEEIPWKTSDSLTVALLKDTLNLPVELVYTKMPANAKIIYTASADSVYRRMLWPSDNFVAEQLLLVCSSTLSADLSTRLAIDYCKKNFMNDLPQAPQWVDGSGLSRQNLFTPESTVVLLRKIAEKISDEERLYGLLPAGGVSGTLRNLYKTDNGKPFIWAKTGSLSNNNNQSGYLVTRNGKKLIFSYMNNNFVRPANEIRAEMARIMTEIHNRF
ncbi:MAG: D-alanyl-D-alanine carboxypeptidase/D-alanyl-D-alanine-endopeptidase [Sphingobacteriaceae bacterium]